MGIYTKHIVIDLLEFHENHSTSMKIINVLNTAQMFPQLQGQIYLSGAWNGHKFYNVCGDVVSSGWLVGAPSIGGFSPSNVPSGNLT